MDSRIKVIDGLRGIAIIMVVWHHLFSHLFPPGYLSLGPANAPIHPLSFLANGWLGVNLFFVLSGFVLFYPYVTEKRNFSTKSDWLTYYRNRMFRLLPLYYVSVIYGFLFISPPQSVDQFLGDSFFMLTATYSFTKELWYPPYNWVLWSLGIEIWFSILFPFLVVLTNRFNVVRTGIFVLIFAIGIRYLGMAEIFQLKGSPYLGILRDSVLGRLDDFYLGMFVAWFWLKTDAGKNMFWSQKRFAILGIGLFFISCNLWDYWKLGLLNQYVVPMINSILLLGLFLILMFFLNKTSKILSSRFFTLPGAMCYSIYIWHGVLMIQILGADRSFFKVLGYFAVLLFTTYISFNLIERHVRFRPVSSLAKKPGRKK